MKSTETTVRTIWQGGKVGGCYKVRFPAVAGFFQATVHFLMLYMLTVWLELGFKVEVTADG